MLGFHSSFKSSEQVDANKKSLGKKMQQTAVFQQRRRSRFGHRQTSSGEWEKVFVEQNDPSLSLREWFSLKFSFA
jgi:hypothetical protein